MAGTTSAILFESIACSCPDFFYRGRLRPCKHVKTLREALAVIAATNLKWAMKTMPSLDGINS